MSGLRSNVLQNIQSLMIFFVINIKVYIDYIRWEEAQILNLMAAVSMNMLALIDH